MYEPTPIETPINESLEQLSNTSSTDCKDKFWESLERLCGQTYQGVVTQDNTNKLTGSEMVIQVFYFNEQQIHISVQIGNDYSRTWVLTNLGDYLDLRHVHRNEEGIEEIKSEYGGLTKNPGTENRQEFPADAYTTQLISGSNHTMWAMEIDPGKTFSYFLSNLDTERNLKIQFDISRPLN